MYDKYEIDGIWFDGDCWIMLQLINANGGHTNVASLTDDTLPPVLDIKLSINAERLPKRLLLQPENKPIEFEVKADRAYFSINRVDIHNVVEVVY